MALVGQYLVNKEINFFGNRFSINTKEDILIKTLLGFRSNKLWFWSQ